MFNHNLILAVIAAIAPTLLALASAIVYSGTIVGDRADKIPFTRKQRIFVCSPLRGDLVGNRRRAEQYCAAIARGGRIPFCPHAYYSNWLDDNDPVDRELGISMGLEELGRCDELWCFTGAGGRISEGMKREIAEANRLGIPVKVNDPGGAA